VQPGEVRDDVKLKPALTNPPKLSYILTSRIDDLPATETGLSMKDWIKTTSIWAATSSTK
jgi:hypothetical protein